MTNPLLENLNDLPPFTEIKPEHVETAIEQRLQQARLEINQLLDAHEIYSWENLIEPLDQIQDVVNRTWSPVSHMNSVVNSDELRQAYNNCLPKLSEFSTEISQNPRLYKAYKSIANSDAFSAFNYAQQKVINDALRDFHLSGIDLPAEKQARYKSIRQELSKLTSAFSDNVLDATNAWKKLINDEAQLSGLPDSAIATAKQTAQRELKGEQKKGWLFTLEFPSYLAVMSYADDRQLREEFHQAYVTRASDQGPHAGKWDNSALMQDILKLRHELAQLLGFANYAEYSLATKMADSTDKVLQFLNDLAQKSKPMAQQEYNELKAFAQQHGVDDLQAWDAMYFSEKLRQHLYDISQETLKPYFPEPQVISGMFEVVKRLYDMSIVENNNVNKWHKDVRFFEIRDADHQLRGQFYMDLYARPNKRGGAWMDSYTGRMKIQNKLQTPVAYLTCNFSSPIGDQPALFTHNEVITLFHEFGHGLHHMLTQVDYMNVSGINGVAWDAVELPSQFMENWCWQKPAIDLIAKHYQNNLALPQEIFDKMNAAKNFQSGMQMLRQLEFALFDFRLHLEYDPDIGARIQETLDQVRQAVAVVKPATYNRFQHSFSHIFAGGYAAGYYSYKWAEVLSADAFAKFEETGIFNPHTGKQFLQSILEQGGSREPLDLFIEFRGREPSIDALLRHSGIAA